MNSILHFSNKPPYPTLDGGCVAIKHMLEALVNANQFEVHHFTLDTHKHPFHISNYPEFLQNNISIQHCFLNTKTRPLHALKHLITNSSYNVSRFENLNVKKRLKQLLSITPFDLVIVESIYLLPYLDLFKSFGVKVVVRTHNVEHHIWEGLAQNEAKRLKRNYLNLLVKQLKKYELTALKQVDGVINITNKDEQVFIHQGISVPSIVIPPIVETCQIPANYQLNDFYFLGAMDWLPNTEALEWLKKKVLPHISLPVQIHLAGKGGKKEQTLNTKIVQHGEVPNAQDFMNAHGICLIPLQSGSGVKIKLLENMGLGKAIITTSEGAKGVAVTDGKEVLIADTPQSFATAMETLHNNETLRAELGKNAKAFISKNYNPTTISNTLVSFLQNI